MKPGVPVCKPAAAVLGLFCRGCLSRVRSLPGHRFSSLPRQMSRWNSQETCGPPPPQENPRVLITGNISFCSPSSSRHVCILREIYFPHSRIHPTHEAAIVSHHFHCVAAVLCFWRSFNRGRITSKNLTFKSNSLF